VSIRIPRLLRFSARCAAMMHGRPRTIALLVAAAAVALVVILVVALRWRSGRPPTDEERLRAAIAEIASRAADKDLDGMLEHVSARYRGEGENREGLGRLLRGYFLVRGGIFAYPTEVTVTVSGDHAHTSTVAILARARVASVDELRPELTAGRQQVEVDWAREGERWRIINASWQSLDGPE
jgi:hypothetical protein